MPSEPLSSKRQTSVPLWTEIIGWYGALAILGAYAAVSFALIEPGGLLFQLLNISGALGLLLIAFAKRVYQNVFLNGVWIAIGLVALVGIIFT